MGSCDYGNEPSASIKGLDTVIIIIIIIIIILTANRFLPGGSGTTIRHNTQHTSHKITHHAQTKYSTKSYTNNKGHTTHKDYNANTITATTIKLQLQLYILIFIIHQLSGCQLLQKDTVQWN
jgi:hypothetical protein